MRVARAVLENLPYYTLWESSVLLGNINNHAMQIISKLVSNLVFLLILNRVAIIDQVLNNEIVVALQPLSHTRNYVLYEVGSKEIPTNPDAVISILNTRKPNSRDNISWTPYENVSCLSPVWFTLVIKDYLKPHQLPEWVFLLHFSSPVSFSPYFLSPFFLSFFLSLFPPSWDIALICLHFLENPSKNTSHLKLLYPFTDTVILFFFKIVCWVSSLKQAPDL